MAADGGEKRLILILNKIDLVPAAALKERVVGLSSQILPDAAAKGERVCSECQVI